MVSTSPLLACVDYIMRPKTAEQHCVLFILEPKFARLLFDPDVGYG